MEKSHVECSGYGSDIRYQMPSSRKRAALVCSRRIVPSHRRGSGEARVPCMYPYPIAHFVDEDGKETKLHQTQHKVLKGGVKSWRAVRAWTRDGDAGRNDESDGHSAKRARETVPDEPAPARPSFPRASASSAGKRASTSCSVISTASSGAMREPRAPCRARWTILGPC